jgi:hypothetical protein
LRKSSIKAGLSELTISWPLILWKFELFRYQGAAKDGATLEYVFEAGEQNTHNVVTKEKAAEIAADFMTSEHWKRRNFGQLPFRFG